MVAGYLALSVLVATVLLVLDAVVRHLRSDGRGAEPPQRGDWVATRPLSPRVFRSVPHGQTTRTLARRASRRAG